MYPLRPHRQRFHNTDPGFNESQEIIAKEGKPRYLNRQSRQIPSGSFTKVATETQEGSKMTREKREIKIDLQLGILAGCAAGEGLLDSPQYIEKVLRRAAAAGWFTLFRIAVQQFEPQGISGIAVIGESHICIHTWPEREAAFVDVGSCLGAHAAKLAWDSIVRDLKPAKVLRKAASVAFHELSELKSAPT
ncbi:MAG TPA: hypothetical protein EYP14_02465 [Planctomycetaceae bacterium]|nr:hypothetical protein [Planctomycetaceae bacterium]